MKRGLLISNAEIGAKKRPHGTQNTRMKARQAVRLHGKLLESLHPLTRVSLQLRSAAALIVADRDSCFSAAGAIPPM